MIIDFVIMHSFTYSTIIQVNTNHKYLNYVLYKPMARFDLHVTLADNIILPKLKTYYFK